MDPDQTRRRNLAEVCRKAITSLDCELLRREKLVIEQIVRFSFDINLDTAFFGSLQQLAAKALLDEGSASAAVSALKRNGFLQREKAQPLKKFRLPIRLTLLPDELTRVTKARVLSAAEERKQTDLTTWLVHANRVYPLEPEFWPLEGDDYLDSWAENSRTSALVRAEQNEGAKSGQTSGAPPSAHTAAPGLAPRQTSGTKSAARRAYPDLIHRLMAESMEGAAVRMPVGESPTGDGTELEKDQVGETPTGVDLVIGDSPTASCAPDQISDSKIESLSSLSEHQIGASLVGETPTWPKPEQSWAMPTVAEELFGEVLKLMGRERMANYSSWWFDRCKYNRQAVYETIAANKLARIRPEHNTWTGPGWRKVFLQQAAIVERVRLTAEATA